MQDSSVKTEINPAFTLVELLLVILVVAIIALLLFPRLSSTKMDARSAKCMANLRQFGAAHALYANDNHGVVLETRETSGRYRSPEVVTISNSANPPGISYLTWEALSGYVPGVTPLSKDMVEIEGIWWCPASPPPAPADVTANLSGWGWFSWCYSYFGRVDHWTRREASQPRDLTAQELDPNRLLMADILNFAPGQGKTWSYNHGKFPGFFRDSGAIPSFDGMNELYGDGRVAWKSVNKFNLPSLHSTNKAVGQVRAYGADSVFY